MLILMYDSKRMSLIIWILPCTKADCSAQISYAGFKIRENLIKSRVKKGEVIVENIKIEINIPKEMASYIDFNDSKMEFKRNAMLLYVYIENNTISHGKAAELLGVNKYDLIEFYESMGLPYYNMSIEEIEEELETFRNLKGVMV